MSIQTKTSLPIVVEQFSLITGLTISKKELFNVISIMNDYGPGSGFVLYREESKLHYSTNPSHLGGFNGMVQRLAATGAGDVPLNAIQRSIFLGAFPNSAKKKLSAFKTPNEILNWFKTAPQEVMDAGEVALFPITDGIKQSRAAQILNAAELRAYIQNGAIPDRLKTNQAKAPAPSLVDILDPVINPVRFSGTYSSATSSATELHIDNPANPA